MNTTRQQQLLSLIKRIVSTKLQEIDHEALHNAVITDALLSNDGRECRIWVAASDNMVRALNTKYQRDIQHGFMKQYARKIVPKILFLKDTGELEHLDAMLAETEKEIEDDAQ